MVYISKTTTFMGQKKDALHSCNTAQNKPLLLLLVAWSSGRTSVFGRRAFAVLGSTCSWWV